MIFGYARVSKASQNLDLQIDAIKKYGVDELYQEKASGVKTNRSQLTELLSKLRSGDILVIWKLDRLGRTMKQLIALIEDFNERGISLVSLTENFDTTNAYGMFALYFLCAVAQMERDVISERTLAGLDAARTRGRYGGRTPKEPKAVERALKMYYSNEFSIKEIVDSTGCSKSTIYKYIKKDKRERNM